jgi:predicted acylesterase/phospholipase RssA
MDETDETESSRVFGPGVYIPFLARVPLLVCIVLVVTLTDLAIPGSMREALRYSILDQPHQLMLIVLALAAACVAVRFTAEAIIELVAPSLYDGKGAVHRLSHILPRGFAFAIGAATAAPFLALAVDTRALPAGPARLAAAGMGLACLVVGFAVAALVRGPHQPKFAGRRPSAWLRLSFAVLPLLVAVAFAGTVLGLWQRDSGTADHALERYVSAFVGTLDDGSSPHGALQAYVRDASGATVARYVPYIKFAPYAVSTVSATVAVAEILCVYLSCLLARLVTAIVLDLLFPRMGSTGIVLRLLRIWLPRAAAVALGAALGVQMLLAYLLHPMPGVHLTGREVEWVWAIAAIYLAAGQLASLGSGSIYVADGPWRESPSVGRRFLGAAGRLSALDGRWQWFIAGALASAVAVFLLFADLHYVWISQWLGPVAIILLWGFVSSVLFFPVAYLSHMTRVHMLTILLLAAMVFAGFNLNDNHELRVVAQPGGTGTAVSAQALSVTTDRRQTLDLAQWIASRQDWNAYAHYPVFLVATEGGGIRAAYFTASVLAALQERCPAFAQHTLAISGVSGGSLGAAVYAGLAGDHASNTPDPGCNLAGIKAAGPVVTRARSVLGADLLSPLLGAMLFPDALQRILPAPIAQTDRARAIEYAVEDSWREATNGACGRCDSTRMAERATDLYNRPAPANAAPFRDAAEIDDSKFDAVKLSPSTLEQMTLQDRMTNDAVPLSSAAIVSARFPYLTPPGSLSYSGGHYVDGGYFENSGTWILSGLVQYLIGQQLSYPAGQSPQLDAARNAVFVVIVIQSEPCTRESVDAGCDEDATTADDSWAEALSPLRALLSTRGERANYSLDSLNAVSALIEQFSARNKKPVADGDVGCDYPVCAVTLRFRNHTHTDIPLTWVLSSAARDTMDKAVDGMERADVRFAAPPASISNAEDTQDIDRVLGSYRRVLCMLAARDATKPCTPASPAQ